MKKQLIFLTFLAAALPVFLFTGCIGDSAEGIVREVGLNVESFYRGQQNGKLVNNNPGNAITDMNLRQNGDKLEGVDNNGNIFRGTIGRASGNSASFTLEGPTTAGNVGVIAGAFTVSGNTSVMRGTWAEAALFSTVLGTGVVASNSVPSESIVVSPSSATVTVGATQNFTASGGDGNYTWTQGSRGTISNNTGANTTYTRVSSGTDQLIVTNGSGASASATIN